MAFGNYSDDLINDTQHEKKYIIQQINQEV